MRCAVAVFFGALSLASASDPFSPGSYSIATANGKCGNNSKWSYNVWAPDSNGSFPVIVFVTGGGGITPGATYSNMTASVAAKGVVFITLWRLAPPEPKTDAALLAAALPWLRDNLAAAGLKATANFDQLALSGHSAGNHVVCSYLQSECGMAKAAVLMDPVDGYDPFGMLKNYCITPGQKVRFNTPALLMRTGLDPKVKVLVACAPDKLSNQRFFNAWSGPIWMANATQYGHMDLNDPSVSGIGGVICASDKEPKEPYHLQVAGLTSAFLSMVFKGDMSAEDVLTSASKMPVSTEVQHDYNGHSAPFAAGCSHLPSSLIV